MTPAQEIFVSWSLQSVCNIYSLQSCFTLLIRPTPFTGYSANGAPGGYGQLEGVWATRAGTEQRLGQPFDSQEKSVLR